MTSCGPDTQSFNFTHMFDFTDLREPIPSERYSPDSITGRICDTPSFKKFRYILELSGMAGLYNSPQSNCTLFVPSDEYLKTVPESVFVGMDASQARHILKASTLNRKITHDLLNDSPASYFTTRSPANRMFVSNLNGVTYINNDIRLIHSDIEASNGIIHVIDGLISPLMV